MERFWNKFLFFLSLVFICMPTFADVNSQSFVLQGQLYQADGTSPLLDTVNFTLGIYDSSETCLLYEETQTNYNLSATNGLFSIQIGTPTGDPKRTGNDSGLSMATIFANNTVAIRAPGANCAAGYTPSAGDKRKVQIKIYNQTTAVTSILSPMQDIVSAPYATVAETVQGIGPSGIVLVTGNVTQARMDDLASRHTELMALSAPGTYNDLINVAGSYQSGGAFTVATPATGTDAANKDYTDQNFGGNSLNLTGISNGDSVRWNGVNWEVYTPSGVMTESDPTVLASVKDGVSWTEVTGKPATFPPSAHSHYVNEILNQSGAYFSYKPNDVECANGETLVWNSVSDQWLCGSASGGNSLQAADGVPSQALYVDNDGNVGVGTTVPAALLSVGSSPVGGSFRVSASGIEQYGGRLNLYTGGGYKSIQFDPLLGKSINFAPGDSGDYDLRLRRANPSELTIDDNSGGAANLIVTGAVRAAEICDEAGANCKDISTGWSGGTVTSVSAGTGLTGGPITTTGALSVDVGTSANKIVQLDGSARLPAVDGSQLTNLPIASTVLTGFVTGSDTDVTNTDTIEVAIEKIQGQIDANDTDIAARPVLGTSSGNALDIGTIPSCLANQKLQMSVGPTYSWSCVADIDTDTNTNAGTICSAGQYLDGDGTCKTMSAGGSWTDSSGDIYFNTGKVGVGISLPTSQFHIVGADGSGGNAPDVLTVVGGAGDTNANGGGISLAAGAGNGTGDGGNVDITAGTGRPGGNVTIKAGMNTSSGGGDLELYSGGYQGYAQLASKISLGGSGSLRTGNVVIQGGTPNGIVSNSGSVTISTGNNASFSTAAPGAISLTAGNAGSTAKGGQVNITAGNGGSSNADGGDVVINAGSHTGTGTVGSIVLGATNGNVGVGLATPSSKLHIDGSGAGGGLCVTSDGVCSAVPAGGNISAEATLNTGADYAEYFIAEHPMAAGDVVGLNLETGKVRSYHEGDHLLGIVSTKPGVIGNSKLVNNDMAVLVGLLGQVPVNRDQVLLDKGMVYTKDRNLIGFLLVTGDVYINISSQNPARSLARGQESHDLLLKELIEEVKGLKARINELEGN